MIKLKNREWLDQGANRVCYIHPDDPAKVLKLIKPWKSARQKRQRAPWYKKLRSSTCFDDNLSELKALRWLESRMGTHKHFPRCYGMVETDLGEALCVEFIRADREGKLCMTLEQYLKLYGLTEEVNRALDELCRFLYENNIITRDLRCFNIMVRSLDEKVSLVIVDGLGNPDYIPLSSYIPWLGRCKIRRKLRRFEFRIDRVMGECTKRFVFM